MKKLFGIFCMLAIGYGNSLLGQCPSGGVNVQSPMCPTPYGLQSVNISCQQVKLSWRGQQNQTYIVKLFDADSNVIKTEEVKNCNGVSPCSYGLAATGGASLRWDVQAVCLLNGGITIYSYPSGMEKDEIPLCDYTDTSEVKAERFTKVYPNPTSRYINVSVPSQGMVVFSVYDVNGKIVFQQTANDAISATRRLDLNNLSSGMYVLKIQGSGKANYSKFILSK
jgi:hypothetical protein